MDEGFVIFYKFAKTDRFIKSLKLPSYVIPAKAGIQSFQRVLDFLFHGSNDFVAFYFSVKILAYSYKEV
jgi:hypothetical protein